MSTPDQPGFQTLEIPVSAVYEIELVAPGNYYLKTPGARIVGKFDLKRGQKITAALGQQGNDARCGSGGSFLVLESDGEPKPLLIAAGAGSTRDEREDFGCGNIKEAAVANENVGSSGKQVLTGGPQGWPTNFIAEETEDIYCAGAGYSEAPQVSNLAEGCVAPKSYKDGLTGGKGVNGNGNVTEGGFGGGGACYVSTVKCFKKLWPIFLTTIDYGLQDFENFESTID